MRGRSQAGVTLIELLISVTLLSLLTGGILIAMHVGMKAMERSTSRLMANRRVVGASRILEQQLAGIMPVGAQCMAVGGTPGGPIPFFQGHPQSMRLVSSYSIQEASRGYPRILEFQVIPGANGRGVRLVVNEILYTGPLSTGRFCLGFRISPETGRQEPLFPPIEPGPASFVLADKLADCRFFYQQVLPTASLLPERWFSYWPTMVRLPSAVRVEMAPLDPEAGSLQMSTMTVPIRVDRELLKQYGDY